MTSVVVNKKGETIEVSPCAYCHTGCINCNGSGFVCVPVCQEVVTEGGSILGTGDVAELAVSTFPVIEEAKEPEFVKFSKIPRLNRDMIITEKIDGTNAQILITEDGKIYAGSRSRWLSVSGEKNADNHGFAAWVELHKEQLIKELGLGRHFGEWWGKHINRGYDLEEQRFSLFNVTKWEGKPLGLCGVVPILYRGPFSTEAAETTLRILEEEGSLVAPGYMNPEGIVVFHEKSGHFYKKTIGNDGHKEKK